MWTPAIPRDTPGGQDVQYVITLRHYRLLLCCMGAVCLLSIVSSVASLWAGFQWRAEQRSRVDAIEAADRVLAELHQMEAGQ